MLVILHMSGSQADIELVPPEPTPRESERTQSHTALLAPLGRGGQDGGP